MPQIDPKYQTPSGAYYPHFLGEKKPDFDFNSFQLTDEHKEIAAAVLERKENVFFTGGAGTGKSKMIQYLAEQLKRKYPSDTIAVTATTGTQFLNF